MGDLKRGSIMKFDIAIDAHHAGHLEMRLCPFIINGDDQDLSSCTLLQRASAEEAGVNDCTANDDRLSKPTVQKRCFASSRTGARARARARARTNRCSFASSSYDVHCHAWIERRGNGCELCSVCRWLPVVAM